MIPMISSDSFGLGHRDSPPIVPETVDISTRIAQLALRLLSDSTILGQLVDPKTGAPGQGGCVTPLVDD